jgi:tetratricopeptide (TPR) repeat protein
MRNIERGHVTEDEFRSLMQKAIKYIVKHRENVIWGAATAILGGAALIYFLSRNEPQKPEADLMHIQAVSLIGMGRMADAQNMLLQLSEKHANTRPGKLSLYYLGVIDYHAGKYDEALNYFTRYLGKDKGDYLLNGSALYAAGCASEGIKEYEKALGYYQKVAANKTSPFYHLALLALGRMDGMLGNKEKARETLKALLELNPTQDIANDAKFYIGYFN